MELTFEIKDVTDIKVRIPTLSEFLYITDKLVSAYGGGNGAKTGLYLIDGVIRKLSPRECANIMGFPKNFKLHSNRNQCYKQFGNSVVVDVLQHILISINKALQ